MFPRLPWMAPKLAFLWQCFWSMRSVGGVDIFRFQKGTWSRFCRGVWKILPGPKDLWQSLSSFVIEPSTQWQALRIHCVSSVHLVLGAKGRTIQTPFSGNRKQGTRMRKNLLFLNLILAPSFLNTLPNTILLSGAFQKSIQLLCFYLYLKKKKFLSLRSAFTFLLLPQTIIFVLQEDGGKHASALVST